MTKPTKIASIGIIIQSKKRRDFVHSKDELLLELSFRSFQHVADVTDILKMCIKKFDAENIYFDNLTVINNVKSTSLTAFIGSFQYFEICYRHIEDVHEKV